MTLAKSLFIILFLSIGAHCSLFNDAKQTALSYIGLSRSEQHEGAFAYYSTPAPTSLPPTTDDAFSGMDYHVPIAVPREMPELPPMTMFTTPKMMQYTPAKKQASTTIDYSYIQPAIYMAVGSAATLAPILIWGWMMRAVTKSTIDCNAILMFDQTNLAAQATYASRNMAVGPDRVVDVVDRAAGPEEVRAIEVTVGPDNVVDVMDRAVGPDEPAVVDAAVNADEIMVVAERGSKPSTNVVLDGSVDSEIIQTEVTSLGLALSLRRFSKLDSDNEVMAVVSPFGPTVAFQPNAGMTTDMVNDVVSSLGPTFVTNSSVPCQQLLSYGSLKLQSTISYSTPLNNHVRDSSPSNSSSTITIGRKPYQWPIFCDNTPYTVDSANQQTLDLSSDMMFKDTAADCLAPSLLNAYDSGNWSPVSGDNRQSVDDDIVSDSSSTIHDLGEWISISPYSTETASIGYSSRSSKVKSKLKLLTKNSMTSLSSASHSVSPVRSTTDRNPKIMASERTSQTNTTPHILPSNPSASAISSVGSTNSRPPGRFKKLIRKPSMASLLPLSKQRYTSDRGNSTQTSYVLKPKHSIIRFGKK